MDGDKDKKAAPVAQAVPLKPLSNAEKMMWNSYLEFMDKQGMKGNPALDDRNTNLGAFYFNKYKAMTPGFSLTYQDVPRVQADMQAYRDNLVNQYKSGKIAATPDIKSDADIMPNLSSIDGWLGSKTSSHRFPVATATNSNGTTVNYGVNTQAYDQAQGLAPKK